MEEGAGESTCGEGILLLWDAVGPVVSASTVESILP